MVSESIDEFLSEYMQVWNHKHNSKIESSVLDLTHSYEITGKMKDLSPNETTKQVKINSLFIIIFLIRL